MTFTRDIRLKGNAANAARSERRAAEAVRMTQEGMPPKAVARRLGVQVETVRGYLRRKETER
jgi:DNA-binding CsgD family transcriptional regulator